MRHNTNLTMPAKRRQLIQRLYFISQFASIGSAFSASMIGIYESINSGNQKPSSASYIWIIGLGLIAGSIGSFTAHKFQGERIGKKPYHKPDRISYENAPQNYKTITCESAYLFFASSLSIIRNFLLISSLKAFFSNNTHPILLPGLTGTAFFIFKSFCIDLFFESTNSIYDASREIKNSLTDSRAGPLIYFILLKPIAARPKLCRAAIFWIQSAGVLSHTGTEVINFALSISLLLSFAPSLPKLNTVKDFTSSPSLSIPILLSSIFFLVTSSLQAFYFEAEESKKTLEKIQYDCLFFHLASYPFLAINNQSNTNNFYRLLSRKAYFHKIIRSSFYTQGPLHAFSDMMPIVLILRHFFKDNTQAASPTGISLIAALSIPVFIGSCLGTHYSEVKAALHHFDNQIQSASQEISQTMGIRSQRTRPHRI